MSDYEEYDDEYDLEDDLDDDYGFGLLDDDYDDEEILPDAQDINGDILKEINDNVSFFIIFLYLLKYIFSIVRQLSVKELWKKFTKLKKNLTISARKKQRLGFKIYNKFF